MLRSNSKSLGNHVVSPEEEKAVLCDVVQCVTGQWTRRTIDWPEVTSGDQVVRPHVSTHVASIITSLTHRPSAVRCPYAARVGDHGGPHAKHWLSKLIYRKYPVLLRTAYFLSSWHTFFSVARVHNRTPVFYTRTCT